MNKRFDGVFNFVLITGLVLFMAVFGISTIAGGSADRKLGEAPEVKLSELAQHAGKTVRVRARLAADPPLRGTDGRALAFQALTITHEERSGPADDQTVRTVTDYARLAPQVMLASDGESVAGVLAQGVELRFVPETAGGHTGSGGRLPAGAAAALAGTAFTGLPERSGADVSLRSIADGAEVTIHGTVQVVEGTPVLSAPADLPFVVTPLPFDQVVQAAGRSGTINLVFGWGLLLGAVALAFFSIRDRLRGRRGAVAAG